MCGMGIARTVKKYCVTDAPLKHEVQERGRSEMLYENMFKPNTTVGRPAGTRILLLKDCDVWKQRSVNRFYKQHQKHWNKVGHLS